MNQASKLLAGLCAVSLLGVSGACGGPSGRIKDPGEGALVGSRRAGSEVYRPAVKKALQDLLAQYAGETRAQGKMRVAFVGVENKSAEEIRDMLEAINQTVESTLTESRVFTLLAQQFVDAAIREIGARPEQLFLNRQREEFKKVLGKDGRTPDFLLYSKLTSATTQAEGEREVYYTFTLQLIDANTGESLASKSSEIRKGYTP